MYTSYGFREVEVGDIDVVFDGEKFHLFHLILPNHDYIAHAVSRDGLNWRRVDNALFIGEPGAWDDDMLWTMHVSPNPYRSGWWRMFYTGLAQHEQGRIQRVGLAHSPNLIDWEKDTRAIFPLEASNHYYESTLDEGRNWVSFRDPAFVEADGKRYLLVSARSNQGPVIRRGCVALIAELDEATYKPLPPLYYPRRYDDVEVPVAFKLGAHYYLLGSIREDIKVHYWYAERFLGPYQNFADNVLLPKGNYAARVTQLAHATLLWSFYFHGDRTGVDHVLLPPKELVASDSGALKLRSYRGFDEKVARLMDQGQIGAFEPVIGNPNAQVDTGQTIRLRCHSAFEAFVLPEEHGCFRFSGQLDVIKAGKFGLLLHADSQGDGYYISIDPLKGLVQCRLWLHNEAGGIEEAFRYTPLQQGNYVPEALPLAFALLAYGHYIELSLNGYVVLSLANKHHTKGRLGVYLEGAEVALSQLTLEQLTPPETPSYAGKI
jgi:beta-fructofuranosidase